MLTTKIKERINKMVRKKSSEEEGGARGGTIDGNEISLILMD